MGLGHQVLVSPPTNKVILDAGADSAPEEACLPVKAFFGHVRSLIGSVDSLFIPRVVRPAYREYSCPKLIGLPDMIRNSIPDLPPLLVWEMRAAPGALASVLSAAEWAAGICGDYSRGLAAYLKAVHKWKSSCATSNSMAKAGPRVAVLGHKYVTSDPYLCCGVPEKLKAIGANVLPVPPLAGRINPKFCPKPLYWSFEKCLVREALYFLSGTADGVIHVSSFGCGPDSMIGELLHKWVESQSRIPFITLTVDEHTGDAGLLTRLEAFLDMMEANRSHETHIPPHREHVYSAQALPDSIGPSGDMPSTLH